MKRGPRKEFSLHRQSSFPWDCSRDKEHERLKISGDFTGRWLIDFAGAKRNGGPEAASSYCIFARGS